MSKYKKFKFQVIPEGECFMWVINNLDDLDHPVKRIFFNKSKKKQKRGDHAHLICWQTLVCLEGQVQAYFDDGKEKHTFNLKSGEAVTMPPYVWGTQIYGENSYLMVLCSHPYDEEDYERDYQSFLSKVSKK